MDFGGWRNQMGEQMSRNGFPECEREYNARQEAIEMARKDQLDEQSRLNAMGQEREARLMAELAEVKRERDKHHRASKAQNEDITALQAELAACKADADRYQWLRDMNNDGAAMRCVQLCGADMDEAIDEAIKGSAK